MKLQHLTIIDQIQHKIRHFLAASCIILGTALTTVGQEPLVISDISLSNINKKHRIILKLNGLPEPYLIKQSGIGKIILKIPATSVIPGLNYLSNLGKFDIKITTTEEESLITIGNITNNSNIKSFTINAPDRIIVDIEEPEMKPLTTHSKVNIAVLAPYKEYTSSSNSLSNINKKIYEGVIHKRYTERTPSGPLLINVVDVDLNTDSVDIVPALASTTLFNKDTIASMAKKNNAIVGINASFFKPPTGVPLGTLIINEELVTGTIYNRVSLGITATKELIFDRLALAGLFSTLYGNIKIDNVNQPRISKEYILLYTYRWGQATPPPPENGYSVSFINGKITEVSRGAIKIPRNGYSLVTPYHDIIAKTKVGDAVNISVFTEPDWSNIRHAIGGGPFLVKNGSIYIDTESQKFKDREIVGSAPRTAVGLTKDNHLLLVTVDGRQRGISVGVTLRQLAGLMAKLGCHQAINFDGGSSTQMYVMGDVVNSPTVVGGNRVSNGIFIIPKAKSTYGPS